MKPASLKRLSELSVGLLIVIVIRSLGEVFRLSYVYGDALTLAQTMPFVTGAEIAAVAAVMTFFLFCIQRHLMAIIGTAATVVGLVIYKVLVVG